MSHLVYINGSATWCASSLRAAQFLAEASICDGKALKIVSNAESLLGQVWIYDYRETQWIEQAGGTVGSREPLQQCEIAMKTDGSPSRSSMP